jgi:serine/threonine protein kinase
MLRLFARLRGNIVSITGMKHCPKCKAEYPGYAMVCPLDGVRLIEEQASEPDPLIDAVLDDRYRILSRIGEGGMGKVYMAEHTVLQKTYAVKVLHHEYAADEEAARRFTNEARIASRIGHENIVEVNDFGRTPNGSFYFVMEYLKGQSLAEVVEKFGQLPIQRCVSIAKQIARALASAHRHGVIHRDLKPENILLTSKGELKDYVKILDFGIAKMRTTRLEKQDRKTASGIILGTPAFMSPEQAAGREIDARTDMYSLGVIMYEMLAGRLPFDSQNVIKTLVMHQTQTAAPLRAIRPEIGPALEAIVNRCLQKKPEKRFADMDELQAALEGFDGPASRAHEALPERVIQDPNAVLTAPPAFGDHDVNASRSALFTDPSEVWYDRFEKPNRQGPDAGAAQPQQPPDRTAGGAEPEESRFETTSSEPSLELYELARDPSTAGVPVPKTMYRPDLPSAPRRKAGQAGHRTSLALLLILGLAIGLAIFYAVKTYMLPQAHEGPQSRIVQVETGQPAAGAAGNADAASHRRDHEKEEAGRLADAEKALTEGRFAQAAEGFEAALIIRPDSTRALLGAAEACRNLGRDRRAVRHFERYLELAPDGPGVHRARAFINRYYGR